jgi:hypothetical protein
VIDIPANQFKTFIFIVVFSFCIAGVQMNSADAGVSLKNGDHISGRVVHFTHSEVAILTSYAGVVHIDRKSIAETQISEPMQVELVSGERLIGTVILREDGNIEINSQILGERKVSIDAVKKAVVFSKTSELLDLRGKGTNDALPEATYGGAKPIGQKPEDEEDIRKIFLRQSSVLLRRGEVEVEADFDYQRTQFNSTIANSQRRMLSLIPSLRVGLSDRAEAFIVAPVSYSQLELAFGGSTNSNDTFGFGDVSAGIKYVLVDETNHRPSVIFSTNLSAPTGGAPNETGVFTGSGHWTLKNGLVFIKTYDPISLFCVIDYTHSFKSRHFYNDDIHDVQPGEAVGYNFGFGFAINGNIAISSQLTGIYATNDQIDGNAIGGSSREPISLRLALTDRWSKNTYIEPSVTFGLNRDASDVRLMLALVHRFGK